MKVRQLIFTCIQDTLCLMIYIYHRNKSPIGNRFNYSMDKWMRMLVTFYDCVFVTLSSDNYIGHEKKIFITVNRIYLLYNWNSRWSGRAF